MGADKYIAEVKKLIEHVEKTQLGSIQRAADLIADAIMRDRLIYVFGAGHSHLLAYDVFARAGGLVHMQVIADLGLDFAAGANRQGGFERLPGYAQLVIRDYDIQPGDVMIVISQSGRNPAPVEMALEGKARGATIIALTSMPHTMSITASNPSGKRLFEVADLVLDNGCPPGDALVRLEGLPAAVSPGSTVIGALILQAVVAQVAQNLLDRGQQPAVFMSGNTAEGSEYNKKIRGETMRSLAGRMRHY
ncbi:MAG: sugar isomerase domain-containing protein [Anaerolineae bacterium]